MGISDKLVLVFHPNTLFGGNYLSNVPPNI